jgi:hypothetical protein
MADSLVDTSVATRRGSFVLATLPWVETLGLADFSPSAFGLSTDE